MQQPATSNQQAANTQQDAAPPGLSQRTRENKPKTQTQRVWVPKRCPRICRARFFFFITILRDNKNNSNSK
jgi:hypothetical protein